MPSKIIDQVNKLTNSPSKKKRIHCLSNNGDIYVSELNSLFRSNDCGNTWFADSKCPINFKYKLLNSSACVNRLLRLGIRNMDLLQDGTKIVVFNKTIYRSEAKEKYAKSVFQILRGKHPLFLRCVGLKDIYWGEYFGNPSRDEVYVYASDDGGQSFHIAYVFPENTIRHVHGIFHDPYENKIWVTTGDRDQESAIWVTDDRFRTIEKVVGGNQQMRAVQLLFTKSYVYFGSDTTLQRNYVYRIDKKTGRIEILQEVENCVFWGCKVGKYLFFSTAVEPSKVNKCRDACIWGSKDGENWKCIVHFRKDIWPMKLFQYGQIFFPSGENNTGYLWFTPFATEKHLTVQRLDVREIF